MSYQFTQPVHDVERDKIHRSTLHGCENHLENRVTGRGAYLCLRWPFYKHAPAALHSASNPMSVWKEKKGQKRRVTLE